MQSDIYLPKVQCRNILSKRSDVGEITKPSPSLKMVLTLKISNVCTAGSTTRLKPGLKVESVRILVNAWVVGWSICLQTIGRNG